jgi:hypothetical protein
MERHRTAKAQRGLLNSRIVRRAMAVGVKLRGRMVRGEVRKIDKSKIT